MGESSKVVGGRSNLRFMIVLKSAFEIVVTASTGVVANVIGSPALEW